MSGEALAALCAMCPYEGAHAVASRGPVPAQLLFLSGAPRHHDERAGAAFVSPLASWLEDLFHEAGIAPSAAHYATLTGCRPPHQRPLREADVRACSERLYRTIKAVDPLLIVLCGQDVLLALFPQVATRPIARGSVLSDGDQHYYPMRYPFAAIHHEPYVTEVREDLQRLAGMLAGEPYEAVLLERTVADHATGGGGTEGSRATDNEQVREGFNLDLDHPTALEVTTPPMSVPSGSPTPPAGPAVQTEEAADEPNESEFEAAQLTLF